MFERLVQFDTALFQWVNGTHCTVLDWVMWSVSQHWCWALVLLAAFASMTLRKERRRWWLVLAAMAMCFLLADQTSCLVKEWVCRLRPCHALDDVRMFRTSCGGQYGFVSSHAANAFAIVAFLWLRYRRRCPIATVFMLIWAMVTCYSRAYLGKHYPGDLLGGALLGTIIGIVVWLITNAIEKRLKKSETK